MPSEQSCGPSEYGSSQRNGRLSIPSRQHHSINTEQSRPLNWQGARGVKDGTGSVAHDAAGTVHSARWGLEIPGTLYGICLSTTLLYT